MPGNHSRIKYKINLTRYLPLLVGNMWLFQINFTHLIVTFALLLPDLYRQFILVVQLLHNKMLAMLFQGYWSRCFPVYKQIRKELNEGTIGEINLVKVSASWPGET